MTPSRLPLALLAIMILACASVLLPPRAAAAGCGADSDCAGNGKCKDGKCGGCGFDSDCGGNGRCKDGKCGGCGFDSDCKSGKCKDGKCGGCGFDSDCKGHGKCKDGRCGSCGFNSDCAIGICKDGRCGACSFDSECKGGKCSGGHCTNALFASAGDEEVIEEVTGYCPTPPSTKTLLEAGIALVRAGATAGARR